MNSSILDVIVIGAGHAGLSISYHLKKLRLSHIVFEKGKIVDTVTMGSSLIFKLIP